MRGGDSTLPDAAGSNSNQADCTKGPVVTKSSPDCQTAQEGPSFRDLVARAGQGDEDALTRLLEHCEPKFRIVARVSLGPLLRPQLDTLDLVQSLKRMLIPGLRAGAYTLDSPEQLVALAATIIRRKVALHWRRQRRQAIMRLPDDALDTSGSEASRRRVEDWENEEFLDRLLHSLNEEEQQLFRMQLNGLTIVEIARLLGCRPGPLRAKLSRLRKKLRGVTDVSWT